MNSQTSFCNRRMFLPTSSTLMEVPINILIVKFAVFTNTKVLYTYLKVVYYFPQVKDMTNMKVNG